MGLKIMVKLHCLACHTGNCAEFPPSLTELSDDLSAVPHTDAYPPRRKKSNLLGETLSPSLIDQVPRRSSSTVADGWRIDSLTQPQLHLPRGAQQPLVPLPYSAGSRAHPSSDAVSLSVGQKSSPGVYMTLDSADVSSSSATMASPVEESEATQFPRDPHGPVDPTSGPNLKATALPPDQQPAMVSGSNNGSQFDSLSQVPRIDPADPYADNGDTSDANAREEALQLLPTLTRVPADPCPAQNGTSENETRKRRWARILFYFVVVVGVLAVSVPVGWALRVRDIKAPSPTEDFPLVLFPTLLSLDPTTQSMTLEWDIGYSCGVFADGSNLTCSDVDIYFDQNLLQSSPGSSPGPSISTNDVPTTPIFHINGTVWNHGNDTQLQFPSGNATIANLGNTASFRTPISLIPPTSDGRAERTLQAYPFDRYTAKIYVFATDNSSNQAIPITLGEVDGIAPGFSVGVSDSDSENDGFIVLDLIITRALGVRLYAISIIIAIWLVTLTLLVATVSCVIFGRGLAKEVMVIPVATLFAFVQLRGTFPGAPTGFGATIDFMGILPCLGILSFCSVLMIGVFLFRLNPEIPLAGPSVWDRVTSGIASQGIRSHSRSEAPIMLHEMQHTNGSVV
ncbi:hypothetical protein JB92DRAFT_3097813 [Gautieria morchelliformis]|nr:hypothetical protein JB92DRAFT_3097813 [Gautieria morchelliformis]